MMKTSRMISTLAIALGLASGNDVRFLEFPNAMPGTVLKVRKVLDNESGRMVMVSNLPAVSSVSDLLALEAAEAASIRVKNGAMYHALAKRVEKMELSETMQVWIRIKSPEHTWLDKTKHDEATLRQNALDMLELSPLEAPAAVAARYGLSVVGSRGNNMVAVNADKVRLRQMKADTSIAGIWENAEEIRLSPELSTLATSAYMASVPSGAGSGVKVATFENGLTSTFLSCIGVSATYDAFTASDDDAKRHSHATFRTMVSAAPSATFYHRKSLYFNGSGDISYFTNNGIQTASLSYSKGGTSPYSATYSEFISMDERAYAYPYPVFVNPAGNAGYDYGVNWQCYNALSVGNVRHTSNSTYEMAECTQTKNPPPRYGSCISGSGSDCAGDREMPHIVVPGIPSSGSDFAATCLEGAGTVGCGTSWSAPIGNGIAADVIAADTLMVAWPEKVRAALILTAQNVESNGWVTSVDERDGTGTIAGADAVAFASAHTDVAPGNTAVEKGMGAGSWNGSEFSANKRFNYVVPNPKPSGKHLRVVLTWDSNPNVSTGANDLSDLDLIVQKNGGTSSSASWDSNVEVVDVAAADLTAGSSYYIDISPYANRIPYQKWFYYAIAWDWVTDEAP